MIVVGLRSQARRWHLESFGTYLARMCKYRKAVEHAVDLRAYQDLSKHRFLTDMATVCEYRISFHSLYFVKKRLSRATLRAANKSCSCAVPRYVALSMYHIYLKPKRCLKYLFSVGLYQIRLKALKSSPNPIETVMFDEVLQN